MKFIKRLIVILIVFVLLSFSFFQTTIKIVEIFNYNSRKNICFFKSSN